MATIVHSNLIDKLSIPDDVTYSIALHLPVHDQTSFASATERDKVLEDYFVSYFKKLKDSYLTREFALSFQDVSQSNDISLKLLNTRMQQLWITMIDSVRHLPGYTDDLIRENLGLETSPSKQFLKLESELPKLKPKNKLRFWDIIIKNAAFNGVRDDIRGFLRDLNAQDLSSEEKASSLSDFMLANYRDEIRSISMLVLEEILKLKNKEEVEAYHPNYLIALEKVLSSELPKLKAENELIFWDIIIKNAAFNGVRDDIRGFLRDLNAQDLSSEEKASSLSDFMLANYRDEIRSISELTLEDENLFEIPSYIGLFNLTRLNITNCPIQYLPSEIGDLVQLRELSISNSYLKEIPPEIGSLINLTELQVLNSQLRSLPTQIEELRELTKLNISNNNFQIFPFVVTKLLKLKELEININPIRRLPPQIGELRELTRLGISQCRLTGLCEHVEGLKSLKELTIAGNQFEGFPEVLKRLKNLTYINATANITEENDPVLIHLLKKKICVIRDGV